LKGSGKSIHILEEECLKELIVWLQKFVPPPTCLLVKWIASKCQDDESFSHSLILAKHLDPMVYKQGKKYHPQRDFEGHIQEATS
jgi:hypothetical protein